MDPPGEPTDPVVPGDGTDGAGPNPADGGADGDASSGAHLPGGLSTTGASLIALPVGLGLLAAGVVFLVARRRRPARTESEV
ncbi:hypothetical protein [Agromyces sp. H66]|uniref:hypothetical protein n=1 Tax=Agromyces sp. H66 TaxID=2529859 RepID=UPI0010AB1EE7|nr:hypothetical protein [Agromyces sp. H66]